MTLAAMARTLDKVLAARDGFGWIVERHDRLVVQEEHLPETDAASHAERESDFALRRLALHLRKRDQERVKVGYVTGLHPGI